MADKEEKCSVCVKCVNDGEKAMQCDICLLWCHIVCVEVPEALYKALNKFDGSKTGCGFHWYCKACTVGVGKLITCVSRLAERQENMETELKSMMSEVVALKGIKKELDEVKKDSSKVDQLCAEIDFMKKDIVALQSAKTNIDALDQKLDTTVRSFSDIVKSQEAAAKSVATKVEDKQLRAQVNEALEREKRKNNLVVFGLPDGDNDATMECAKKLCEVICKDEDIYPVAALRLGKPGTDKGPVRLTFSSGEEKLSLLQKAKNLKNEKEYEKVYVTQDLTKSQQEEDKKLRDKLKEMRTAGETDIKINKGQIVKFVSARREVVFGGW